MRYLITALVMICMVGCGSTDQSTPSSTYQPPTNYAAAVRAAQSPEPLGLPVGPWECAPIKIIGTPGVILTLHSGNLSVDYTANAQGNFYSATGGSLNMLIQPKTTLWVTVASPLNVEIQWSGAQFVSADNMGATWTAPAVVSGDAVWTIIRCDVTPSGDG
jgi:hypothetical protein